MIFILHKTIIVIPENFGMKLYIIMSFPRKRESMLSIISLFNLDSGYFLFHKKYPE